MTRMIKEYMEHLYLPAMQAGEETDEPLTEG
jgi:hypothetical protein